jgi:tetratricopeptide (TPR) repeat protein
MSTLKPTKKISRRQELRQDTVVTFSSRVWQALDNNRNLAYGILGVIALVVVGIIGYSYWQQQREADGQRFLAPAVSLYESGDYEAALNGSDDTMGLLAVASDYSMTNAGNLARFYAADALFRLGEYDRSLELFEDFDKDANYLGASALAGEAAIHEMKGQYERAGDLFRRAAFLFPNDVTAPGYLLEAGRAYELAGDYQAAVDAYNAVTKEYPTSTQARNVDILVARAGAMQAPSS